MPPGAIHADLQENSWKGRCGLAVIVTLLILNALVFLAAWPVEVSMRPLGGFFFYGIVLIVAGSVLNRTSWYMKEWHLVLVILLHVATGTALALGLEIRVKVLETSRTIFIVIHVLYGLAAVVNLIQLRALKWIRRRTNQTRE